MVSRNIRRLVIPGIAILGFATLTANCSAGSPDVSPYFAVAKSQWKTTASTDAYELQFADLEVAASLEVGLTHDADASSIVGMRAYKSAIVALKDLAAMPETNLSTPQQTDAQRDLATLDRFFGTPGLGT
jgi:hypothetical protein